MGCLWLVTVVLLWGAAWCCSHHRPCSLFSPWELSKGEPRGAVVAHVDR